MEEKHKTTLSPNNGDFYKTAFGFIRIWYLLFIRHVTCFFYRYNHLDDIHWAGWLSQVPGKLLDYY